MPEHRQLTPYEVQLVLQVVGAAAARRRSCAAEVEAQLASYERAIREDRDALRGALSEPARRGRESRLQRYERCAERLAALRLRFASWQQGPVAPEERAT